MCGGGVTAVSKRGEWDSERLLIWEREREMAAIAKVRVCLVWVRRGERVMNFKNQRVWGVCEDLYIKLDAVWFLSFYPSQL